MGQHALFEYRAPTVMGETEVKETLVIQGNVIPASAVQHDGVMPGCCEQCGSHEGCGHCQTAATCRTCRQPACVCRAKAHLACLHCGRRRIAAAANFNCSCQGSYKFPVPRQYTYHWPGMYSQQQMTAYSSPYRFPPLELPPGFGPAQPRGGQLASDSLIRPTSAVTPAAPASVQQPRFERTSEKLKRMHGLK